jgi:hypothetical protein
LRLHQSSGLFRLTFSQASQNVAMKAEVGRSVRRNKFTMNPPFNVEKTMSMLFVGLRTRRTLFALDGCGLFRFNDSCFVSGSLLYSQLSSPVMVLEIEVGPSLTFSHC